MLSKLFWIALTVFFTFAWLVLFDHGWTNYVENFKQELKETRAYWATPMQKDKKDGGVL